MKTNLVIALLISGGILVSCVEKPETAPKHQRHEVERLQTVEAFDVPVRANSVTRVMAGDEVVAEAVSPMSVLLPSAAARKATLQFVPLDEYPNTTPENRSKFYQVVCFEDSRSGDYDYNDLVIHVKYETRGNIYGFGVHPIALGSKKSLRLGCCVYKGDKLVYKDILNPVKDCRAQYFESQDGYINTQGETVNQQNGGWHQILGSTIRNWDYTKIEGNGAMRVEWYIVVDNNTELYALSTEYLDASFDKNGIPYGLIISNTGAEYTDAYGQACGNDWFNYPLEMQHIRNVYPMIWEWLTSGKSYDFADFYDPADLPANAYPAIGLRLYEMQDANVCDGRYKQN